MAASFDIQMHHFSGTLKLSHNGKAGTNKSKEYKINKIIYFYFGLYDCMTFCRKFVICLDTEQRANFFKMSSYVLMSGPHAPPPPLSLVKVLILDVIYIKFVCSWLSFQNDDLNCF